MASQSQKGGASWSEYLRRAAVQYGWRSVVAGQPFNPDYSLDPNSQREYEAGRQMALESGMACPQPARRVTKEITAVRAAIPAFMTLLRTEHSNAREEAKRAAALRLKLRHHENRRAA
jgi:hypothetical protein